MAVPKRINKPIPLKGRNTSMPPESLGDEYSPNALNVRFRFGEVRPAPGRGLFDAAPINEQAQVLSQFGLVDETLWPFYLTLTRLFRRGNTQPFNPNGWFEVNGAIIPSPGSRRWSWTSGEDHLFFCRGADSLIQWDGQPGSLFDLVSNDPNYEPIDGIPGATTAPRYLEYFADRVICANVVEIGVVWGNRLRWPQSGDFRKWDSTLGLGAGFLDIVTEFSQPILGIKALSDRLAVYTRSSIIDVVQTGQIDPTFVYHIRVRGIGLAAPYTLAKANQVHFFLGKDLNVWAWDGIQIQRIGDPVWKELQALVHQDSLDKYFGFVAPTRSEYWLVLSDPDRGTYEAFIFDYGIGAWSRDTFPSFTAGDEIDLVTGALTWNDLVGSWSDQTLTWEQFGGTVMAAIVGGRNDGSTMVIDEMYGYDYFAIGSVMDCILETPDMYCPEEGPWKLQEVLRVILLYDPVTAGADPFEVGISFDQGRNWDTKTVSPGPLGYSYIDFVKTGYVVRYRFRERDANVHFRWRSYGYQYVVSGDTPPGPTA